MAALRVSIAHTGQHLQADPSSFTSLEAFKNWVARNSPIAAPDHISLTPQGKAVRLQTLQTEKDVFIYDRRIIQPSSADSAKSLLSQVPLPSKYLPTKPSDPRGDDLDLQAWRDVFMARRSWAQKVVDDCVELSDRAQQRYDEAAVMTQCVDAAVWNLERHVKSLDHKNAEVQSWAADLQKEQDAAGSQLKTSVARLPALPTTAELVKFVTGRDPRSTSRKPCLEDLLNMDDVKKAGKLAKNISTKLNQDSVELGVQVDEVLRKTDELFERVENNPARSAAKHAAEPVQLLQDIQAIGKRINSDYSSVQGYPNTPKSVTQAAKQASLQTRNFLPTLIKRSQEMDGILRSATELRNSVAVESVEVMHDIATLTSALGEINTKFAALELDQEAVDAFNLLAMADALPVTYASLIAEGIRRREWGNKIKADSSTLVNEMAYFQDEEVRRRRKWQKNIGSTLWGDKSEKSVLGVEVNLQGDEEAWPEVSKKDLEDLLETLRAQDPKAAALNDISKIIADLNNPTKQQKSRAKAFKAGSIHEAALGRSALLVRGDDDLIRSLQDEKSKMEAKLKSAESRVRRLEDVLHRQSHVNRQSTGNVFQLPTNPSPDFQTQNPLASPRLNDDMSRRSSVSSRRFSANQGAEEKALQQKLLSIEAELIAERERSSGMAKEISARTNAASDLKARAEEATSTKKDLMANFDAQQREFLDERKSLEEEIRRLKAKLEELEDEMDRYLGSRENEKQNVDERAQGLQDELEQVRKESTAEAQKAQGQVEFLRGEVRLQREQNDITEVQLQRLREENRELKRRAENAETSVDDHFKVLQDVYARLSGGSKTPESLDVLASALTGVPEALLGELEQAKSELSLAKSDQNTSEAMVTELRTELGEVKEKLATEEMESFGLRETAGMERARFSALEAELADERNQLSTLRSKIADGETGSETLRGRLEEEERKVTSMAEDLATGQSKIGSLEEEVRIFQDKFHSAQAKHEKLSSRFESRTARAKDLTQRMYTQNERLGRLLERLSFAVTRDGESLVIQRLPKQERSNANDSSDPSSSLRRSMSAGVSRNPLIDSTDLDLLRWMHADDLEAEAAKYNSFIQTINLLDSEAVSEAINKRVKDAEYTGKKYARDARAYRDKAHQAQKEAHDKIAVKHFHEGDLALFLPTRNAVTGAWAAFNVGAPHYFLREQDSHKLRTRDWLLARILRIEERTVDLSKSIGRPHGAADRRSLGETSTGGDSFDDDNPFDLSDGLRWYLIDAAEEKPGAPSTPGLGKSTVASAHIDATGSIRRSKRSERAGVEGINKTLSKSLDSRRSSTASKKAAALLQVPPSPKRTGMSTPPTVPVVGTDVTATAVASIGTQANASQDVIAAIAQGSPAGENSEASSIRTGEAGTAAVSSSPHTDPETPTLSTMTLTDPFRDPHHAPSTSPPKPDVSTPTSPTGTSPAKRSIIWDSLWSVDLSLDGGRKR